MEIDVRTNPASRRVYVRRQGGIMEMSRDIGSQWVTVTNSSKISVPVDTLKEAIAEVMKDE